jgi:hypothetical protein
MADPLSVVLGSVIAAGVGGMIRAPGIPADVRRHDAKATSRDKTLETWVTDRNYSLGRECVALRANVTPDGDPNAEADWPGTRTVEVMAQAIHETAAEAADRAIADARSRALHEYRDEATRAAGDVATILAAEGWAHRLYRRAFRWRAPSLAAPSRVAPILDAWRKPSAMSGERMTWPDDATARTLDDAIAAMPVTGP